VGKSKLYWAKNFAEPLFLSRSDDFLDGQEHNVIYWKHVDEGGKNGAGEELSDHDRYSE